MARLTKDSLAASFLSEPNETLDPGSGFGTPSYPGDADDCGLFLSERIELSLFLLLLSFLSNRIDCASRDFNYFFNKNSAVFSNPVTIHVY